MTSGENGRQGGRKGDAARAERLRVALRDNLRRRKLQAKERSGGGEGAGAAHDSAGFVAEKAPDKSKD